MKKRKLIDAEGRLFGFISVVDIVAVLVVAALALMLVNRFITPVNGSHADTPGVGVTADEADVTFEICLAGMRETSAASIQAGDRIYSTATGALLGEIVGTRQEPYIQLVDDHRDGTVKEMTTEGYCDLYVTIRGKCSVLDGHYYLDGTVELVRNATVSFMTPYVAVSGRLMSCEVSA